MAPCSSEGESADFKYVFAIKNISASQTTILTEEIGAFSFFPIVIMIAERGGRQETFFYGAERHCFVI